MIAVRFFSKHTISERMWNGNLSLMSTFSTDMLVFLPSVMMLKTVDPIFVTKKESLLLGPRTVTAHSRTLKQRDSSKVADVVDAPSTTTLLIFVAPFIVNT